MLANGLNGMYRASLATSHQPYLLVEVLDGQQQVIAPIPFEPEGSPEGGLCYLSGNVSATLTSRISRTCSLTVPDYMYPFAPDGLLAPYGNMLRAWRGVGYADGTSFRWPVFIGRIQDAKLNSNGTCSIQAADFAADVLENRFVRPENATASNTVTAEIQRLIQDGFSEAVFGVVEQFTAPARTRTWQLDRGQALDELATSVGAFWYPRADGAFNLVRYPWTVANPTVVTYSDDGPLGVVAAAEATRSRAGVFNSLTVTGERLNGDAPVFALAQDTNAGSITYINGNFGRRHQLLRLQTPGNAAAAQGAANTNLQRLIALVDTWTWSMPVDAALELGDAVLLDVYGRAPVTQVVAAMRIPLDLSGLMAVEGRSLINAPLEGVE